MKFVGLISGGKDSIFNLAHCKRNNHELVAVANLKSSGEYEEMDSYMFQTVGLSVLPLIAQSLGVELFEGVIKGSPIDQSSSYEETLNDETEDLYALLKSVKDKHSDLQGVSVGAILSNYQRVRVEHVCSRLNLTVLAYLWRRPQELLLDEMIAAQQTSIVIKVAGAGLDPVRHLGKSLAQLRPTLDKLHNLYGAHVCGEGGEFETVTLDSPLYKQRIVLDETEIVYHDPSPTAPVAFLRIKKAHLEDKEASDYLPPAQPDLFDDLSQDIQPPAVEEASAKSTFASRHFESQPPASIKQSSKYLSISNLYPSNTTASISEQTQDVLNHASKLLVTRGCQLDKHATLISVYVSDMKDFASLNDAYSAYFKRSGPPARLCVATTLSEGYKVSMSVLASTDKSRSALHVRGLSYWAPANIGPYSQCVSLNNRHFISGQIALEPANLALLQRDVGSQAILALQHARRVAQAQAPSHIRNGELLMRPESVVCFVTSKEYIGVCRSVLSQAIAAQTERSQDALDIDTHEPAQLYLVVADLPKGAAVEWQFVYNDRQPQSDYDSEDEDARKEEPLHVSFKHEKSARKHTAQCHDGVQTFEFFDSGYSRIVAGEKVAATLYYTQSVALDEARKVLADDVTYIPVIGIADKNGQEAQMALSSYSPLP